MKVTRSFTAGLFLPVAILLACTSTNDNTRWATDTVYYLKLVDEEKSERSERMISDLSTEIPGQKYTITHTSGNKAWPWYEEFSLDARLPVDSIMPPHNIFHVFELFNPSKSFREGEYMVKATIRPPLEDGRPVLKFSMYQFKEGAWKRVVNLDDHDFSILKYPTYQDQYRIVKETIIRSSFK